MTHVRGLVLLGMFTIVGCTTTTTKPRCAASESEVAGFGPNSTFSPVLVSATPLEEPPPAPRGEQNTEYFVRTEVFESGSAEVRTVRIKGRLFAASTRAASASDRPTSSVQVVRTRKKPRSDLSHYQAFDSFEVALNQRPGAPVHLSEQHARELLATLRGPVVEGDAKPRLVASEVVFADVRVAFTTRVPDVVQIESPTSIALYDRASLADALDGAVRAIDNLQRTDPPTQPR